MERHRIHPLTLPVRILAAAIFICIGFNSGCQKEGDTPTLIVDTSTEDAIADLVASVIGNAQSTNGFTSQIAYAARIGENDTLWKGSIDSSYTLVVRRDTGIYRYDQTYHYRYTFDSNNPDSVEFNYTDSGYYSYEKMSGAINDNGTFTLTGLKRSGTTYTVDNGTYNRLIEDTLKTRDNRAMSGSITLEFSLLNVSRLSHTILSGTVDILVSFDTADGGSVDYTATLVFSPNDQASLVVNGRSYHIDCKTAFASYIAP